MLYIILSSEKEYSEAADEMIKIAAHLEIPISIACIDNINEISLSSEDSIYFLINGNSVSELVKKINPIGVFIFNSQFLAKSQTKSKIQNQIKNSGVSVPEIIKTINNNTAEVQGKIRYPVYIKSEQHVHGVYRVVNDNGYQQKIKELDHSTYWYIEEAVDAPGRSLIKVYWIKGRCFSRDNQPPPRKDIRISMDSIGKLLKFDCFSADFIIDKDGRHWCIDVNQAPAFFGSKKARQTFIHMASQVHTKQPKSFSTIYKASIRKRGGLKNFILHKMERSAGVFIERVLKVIPQKAQILELGAGTGAISALLARQGFNMTAVDCDSKITPIIRASFSTLKTSGNLYILNGFELHKQFLPKTFHLSFSHGVLEHYTDSEIARLLREQFTVAKLVVFIVPTANMSKKYRAKGVGDERYLSTKNWRLILKNNGFTVKKIFGFGSKEVQGPWIPEIVWTWGWLAKLLAPRAAFNEFWLEDYQQL